MAFVRILLIAIFVCAGPARAEDVDEIMQKAEEGLQKSALLEATFRQKTSLPFMDVPLESEGKFCFSIRDRQNPMIFWEYRKPDISGFLYENGKARLWNAQGEHALDGREMRFLSGMTDQILQWISFDPQKLKKIYEVSAGSSPDSLRFVPRGKSALFKAIELGFSASFDRLRQLRFIGPNDENTVITFNVQTMNRRLSEDCRK